MNTFAVGVFQEQRTRSIAIRAYTMWFNPKWKGCCLHRVQAENGTAAKKLAIAEHRATCMKAKSTEPTA